MSKSGNSDPRDARRLGNCIHCGTKAELAKREDRANVRALWWCFDCIRPAFGGSSFVSVSPEALARLPLVADPQNTPASDRQGSLF